jgi:hypothetical protein
MPLVTVAVPQLTVGVVIDVPAVPVVCGKAAQVRDGQEPEYQFVPHLISTTLL